MDSCRIGLESSKCVETDLKTSDYSEQLLTYMDDQCLAWLYTKMSCFYTVSRRLCVMLLVSKYLRKIPAIFLFFLSLQSRHSHSYCLQK